MLSQVKRILVSDVRDLHSFSPDDPVTFSVNVTLMVGPRDLPGEEIFQLTVATPSYYQQNINSLPRLERCVLLIQEWNPSEIQRIIARTFENAAGETWAEIAAKLGRYASWEFEDYKP